MVKIKKFPHNKAHPIQIRSFLGSNIQASSYYQLQQRVNIRISSVITILRRQEPIIFNILLCVSIEVLLRVIEIKRQSLIEHLVGDYSHWENIVFLGEAAAVDRVVNFRRAVRHSESWNEVSLAHLMMVWLPKINDLYHHGFGNHYVLRLKIQMIHLVAIQKAYSLDQHQHNEYLGCWGNTKAMHQKVLTQVWMWDIVAVESLYLCCLV